MNVMLSELLTDIQDCLAALTGGLNDLRREIADDSNLHLSELRWLPYRTHDQHTFPEVSAAEPVDSGEAMETLLSAITSIHYKEDQHAKSTLRLVGLVGVSASVLESIAEVNRLKQAFKDSVTKVPARQRRILNRHLPALCRLQAYRELVSLNSHPDEVHFFWASNKMGVTRKTVEALKEELSIEQKATASTDIDLLRAIEYDLEQLADMHPHEVVARARPIRLHPQCNIWVDSKLAGQEDAYLPIFYARDLEKDCPQVEAIEDSSQGQRQRSVRSDRKLEEAPLLERLDVYRYREPYREFAEPA